jgi:hypothetical protein
VQWRTRMLVVAVLSCAAGATAAEPARRLDPLQQAVIDSLASPPRTSPVDCFEAAVRCVEIDVPAIAHDYFKKFVAAVGDDEKDRFTLFADLGDAFDAGRLGRLERELAPRDPTAGKIIGAIREAAAIRRRDPAQLAAAAAGLGSPTVQQRLAAADRLAAAQEDALSVLADVLQSAPADSRPATAARQLVAGVGPAARQPLLAWLGSDDVAHWAGAIEAIAASGATDVDDFLFAPALVENTPPAARDAAIRLLGGEPSRDIAFARLAARLDRTLSPESLPPIDELCLEPVTKPQDAARALGGTLTGTVERYAWNPEACRIARQRMSPREARAAEAAHIARDLIALGARDPHAIRLVLLAQLESLLVAAGRDGVTADTIPPASLRQALTSPDGFDPDTAVTVAEMAITHGLFEAAAAACRSIVPPDAADTGAPRRGLLSPPARKALVKALAVPDASLQSAAATALAMAGGDPRYPGSSRVVDVLRHAATATGRDVAIVVHPEEAIRYEIAADISRFGYEAVPVATGREAIVAARESADTTLVLLAARSIGPTPIETVQLLQRCWPGDVPPVLLVVDPLDDGRGCFLTQLVLKFRDFEGVGIVDRLDSFFETTTDPTTGGAVGPRFPDAVAQAAGPQAVDPATRSQAREARLARGREAAALLEQMADHGWEVARPGDPPRSVVAAQYNRDDAAAARPIR